MATIRAYTTIEQSRKLAEILPLESADMHYNNASIKGARYYVNENDVYVSNKIIFTGNVLDK